MNPHGSPQTLKEFGCWLNTWGDRWRGMDMGANREWVKGYERAIHDALEEFSKLLPDWEEGWEKFTSRNAGENTHSAGQEGPEDA